MSDLEAQVQEMARELRTLRDRQEILDCVARYARGCDRHDAEVLASAFHSDSVDEHGSTINPGKDYWRWANEQHAAGSIHNMHHITTHLVDIEGDVAHAESYVIGTFLNSDNATGRILAGRYIDRLERRNGQWGIVVRRTTVEVALNADATFITNPEFAQFGYLSGNRDKNDLTYARPLDLEDHGHRRW